MTDETVPTFTGTASSGDQHGTGSLVEVRSSGASEWSFTEAMDDIWRNVQGAMRSAGYHWSEASMDAWIEEKAREIAAARGEF